MMSALCHTALSFQFFSSNFECLVFTIIFLRLCVKNISLNLKYKCSILNTYCKKEESKFSYKLTILGWVLRVAKRNKSYSTRSSQGTLSCDKFLCLKKFQIKTFKSQDQLTLKSAAILNMIHGSMFVNYMMKTFVCIDQGVRRLVDPHYPVLINAIFRIVW